ncbi:MAG: hypothetical protein CMM74_00535 [Rhodospirillaceae bacterium]|jgi:ribosomal protein S18 acetylase RimI-like enzyme|nr:hypothetical protein [Rhodospirillaceae bacterium]|tara:strand:- start:462 stop:647 length:186 start_codon:yes stop_codon:yes gene_type:complete
MVRPRTFFKKAKEIGCRTMRLDTEKRLHQEIMLYRDMGFVEIGTYYDNPLADILYLEKQMS